MHPRRWSQSEFESMSWHDCQVHSIHVVEGKDGSGELILDLDYILEWREKRDKYEFLLVPAKLRFHEVFGLRISIDWSTPSAAMGPFSVTGIERTQEERKNYKATVWRLPINWPAGEVLFEATGFTQESWGREVLSESQVLQAAQRSEA
jgi:hypothetical protein